MCGGGSAPKPQPQLPEAPRLPDPATSQQTYTDAQRRRRTAGGTILTSSQGVTESGTTSEKTLLGS